MKSKLDEYISNLFEYITSWYACPRNLICIYYVMVWAVCSKFEVLVHFFLNDFKKCKKGFTSAALQH